jgi:hypothetical protein
MAHPAASYVPTVSSRNGEHSTVLYSHELSFVPITTSTYSPQINGVAEAFVRTFKRDSVIGAELRDAETVLVRLGRWFDDYST